MAKTITVGVIGLDTSHSIQFVKRMQDAACPEQDRVPGMKALTCMRFETPFQDKKGLDERQKELEGWGVRVTESFDEAVRGVDALLLEINDPAFHLEYFQRAAALGKPIFLDKPLADSMPNARKIVDTAARNKTRFFSASALRFSPQLEEACRRVPKPQMCTVYGALGKAPAGSSVIWYGVHAFEMLERDVGRRGVVELTEGTGQYGGTLRTLKEAHSYLDDGTYYTPLVRQIHRFFSTGELPVGVEDSVEIMALLDAAEQSYQSGREVAVRK